MVKLKKEKLFAKLIILQKLLFETIFSKYLVRYFMSVHGHKCLTSKTKQSAPNECKINVTFNYPIVSPLHPLGKNTYNRLTCSIPPGGTAAVSEEELDSEAEEWEEQQLQKARPVIADLTGLMTFYTIQGYPHTSSRL